MALWGGVKVLYSVHLLGVATLARMINKIVTGNPGGSFELGLCLNLTCHLVIFHAFRKDSHNE